MKELFYQSNPWWEKKFSSRSIERPKYIERFLREMGTRDIIFIVGLRRVGKTTLMYQLIENLLKRNEGDRILYISLDHPAFAEKSLIDILREYRTIHGLSREEKVFLFFDEIHMKKGFEKELKVIYDMEKAKVFASGSSSLVLRHKGSFMTGRYKKFLIEPLDFQEFMDFRGIKPKKSEEYLLDKYLDDYLRMGGIPEYVLREDNEYLIELVESIIYKDIVGTYGIRNPDVLKKLFVMLAERVGRRFTYNKTANTLGVSVDTIKQYVSYLEETFLIHLVPKHSRSLNERIFSPKKVYFADNGIRNAFIGFKDTGALVENLVFLRIKEKGEVFYHFDAGKEVDFIVGNSAIEVKYKDKIEENDLKHLQTVKARKKLLVSKNAEIKNGVEIIPLVKFLSATR